MLVLLLGFDDLWALGKIVGFQMFKHIFMVYRENGKPRRGGAGILPYAAVKPWAASASVNSSFFSPLSLPFRSMM